jgi:hypothetical protein
MTQYCFQPLLTNTNAKQTLFLLIYIFNYRPYAVLKRTDNDEMVSGFGEFILTADRCLCFKLCQKLRRLEDNKMYR